MLKAEIIGNLGSSAKIVSINGKEFVSFTVAHSEKRNGQEVTTWVSILWYGNGGGLLQYLGKGVKVFVRGDLDAKIYNRKDGSQDVSLSIMAREVQVCQFLQDESQGQQQQDRQMVRSAAELSGRINPTQPMVAPPETGAQDDDLPF